MNEQPHEGLKAQMTAQRLPRAERLSDVLERLAAGRTERITIRELAEVLQDRSFGAFLLVFALPNLIPLPPGATMILGLPVIVIAWQILAGRDKVWLPTLLADYGIEGERFARIIERAVPLLRRAETWIRPRAWFLSRRPAERLFGLYALIVAIVLVIPIPFGNWLPAFAVAIMGAAFAERDGYCLVLGMLLGLIALSIVALIVAATGALLSAAF